jgi:hypothetical protein
MQATFKYAMVVFDGCDSILLAQVSHDSRWYAMEFPGCSSGKPRPSRCLSMHLEALRSANSVSRSTLIRDLAWLGRSMM